MKNKENIITQFKLLLKQRQYEYDFILNDKDKKSGTYRLQAIAKVIKQLEKYDKEILSAKQLKGIEGIGDKSIKRIEEILKTGKLSEVKLTENTEKYLRFIDELEEVIGIGRKKAYYLFKNYNITSIKELKSKYENGEIELPDNILKGLEYVDKIKEKIPREDIKELEEILMDITLEISPKLFGIICGSYRREKSVSNDIDFILVHNDLKTKEDIEKSKINYLSLFVLKLKERNIIVDSLTGDFVKSKYMGICNLRNVLRRIDIRFMPINSYYTAILYFTGSKDTNTKMRQIALSMDYMLNEYGLYNEKGNEILITSEKDVFDELGMEYLSPNKR